MIGTSAGRDRPLRCRLQALGRIALAQPQNAQAGPIAHLRMRLALENLGKQLRGGRPDRFAPVEQARGWPGQVLLMALRTMGVHGGGLIRLVASEVGSDALAAVKDLDRGRRGADLHELAGERIRDAVEGAVELDGVVDVDARLGPSDAAGSVRQGAAEARADPVR